MKKTIAILLAVVMLLGCLGAAAVSAAETSVPGSVFIKHGGNTYTANKGSTITFRVYIQVPEIVENGQFSIFYPQDLLSVSDFNVPSTPGYMINYDENLQNEIKFNFSNTSGCDLTSEKLLIEVMFNVVGEGEGSISFNTEVLCNLQDQMILEKANYRESLDDADIYIATELPTTDPQPTTDSQQPTTEPTDPQQPTTEPVDPQQPTSEPEQPSTSEQDATEEPTDTSDNGNSQSASGTPALSAKTKSLKPGKTFTLKVKNTTEKVTFKSSKTKIATVSSKGVVTALKKGSANITATLASGKKLTCKVTVSSSPKLSAKTVKVKVNKTKTVKLTGKAKAINNKYTNTKIAKITSKKTATSLKVKGLKKGTTTLKIKVNKNTILKLKVTVTK